MFFMHQEDAVAILILITKVLSLPEAGQSKHHSAHFLEQTSHLTPKLETENGVMKNSCVL